ncbi:MAG TPA: cytochrome c-type biogenesis protein CcmH [Candidatus Acidoferrales bacterium]|nr:cytochrome c-type biogenesis protein CcmH [Candidatus Acidoferrales bacterium]
MNDALVYRWRTLLFAALFAAGLASAVAADEKTAVSFQDIEESLTCQCGCGLTVHSCNHLQCGSALPLRDEIREQMALGKDKTAILAHFSEKYGEKILSAPIASGFNLLAWITPFALLGIGAVFVGITLSRWRAASRSSEKSAAASSAPGPSQRSPYDQELERDLKNFDG